VCNLRERAEGHRHRKKKNLQRDYALLHDQKDSHTRWRRSFKDTTYEAKSKNRIRGKDTMCAKGRKRDREERIPSISGEADRGGIVGRGGRAYPEKGKRTGEKKDCEWEGHYGVPTCIRRGRGRAVKKQNASQKKQRGGRKRSCLGRQKTREESEEGRGKGFVGKTPMEGRAEPDTTQYRTTKSEKATRRVADEERSDSEKKKEMRTASARGGLVSLKCLLHRGTQGPSERALGKRAGRLSENAPKSWEE